MFIGQGDTGPQIHQPKATTYDT